MYYKGHIKEGVTTNKQFKTQLKTQLYVMHKCCTFWFVVVVVCCCLLRFTHRSPDSQDRVNVVLRQTVALRNYSKILWRYFTSGTVSPCQVCVYWPVLFPKHVCLPRCHSYSRKQSHTSEVEGHSSRTRLTILSCVIELQADSHHHDRHNHPTISSLSPAHLTLHLKWHSCR